MSSLEERVRSSNRRGSAVAITSNPLESTTAVSSGQLKVKNLADAKPISAEELGAFVEKLRKASGNDELLAIAEQEADPFLFVTADLIQVIEVTTSVKTRLSLISLLGPRVSDPRTGIEKVVNMFRFAQEKSQVEDVFKSRMHTLQGSVFSRGASIMSQGGRGRGRGAAGRGLGSSRSSSVSAAEDESIDSVADSMETSRPFASTGPSSEQESN